MILESAEAGRVMSRGLDLHWKTVISFSDTGCWMLKTEITEAFFACLVARLLSICLGSCDWLMDSRGVHSRSLPSHPATSTILHSEMWILKGFRIGDVLVQVTRVLKASPKSASAL